MSINPLVIALTVLLVNAAAVQAQVQASRSESPRRTGPAAASLATRYSGPVKFDARLLVAERAAARDANPITRSATWRHRYSSPFNYYYGSWGSHGYCSYRRLGHRGSYPFTGGATSLGWWGPY